MSSLKKKLAKAKSKLKFLSLQVSREVESLSEENDSLREIKQDMLEVHRILQCPAECPKVEPGDSKVVRDFKSYCIMMNKIVVNHKKKS